MNTPHQLPSAAQLLKATGIAAAVAAVLLVTAVLPAEYGIDATGVGKHLGLLTLSQSAQAATLPASASAPATAAADAGTEALAAKAVAAFGKQAPGQSFNARAVSMSAGEPRTESMSVTLAPGKGAELKALLEAGQGFVFKWSASGPVALDMHGEVPGANEFTSYDLDKAQTGGAGTFIAPFAGQHGWYWKNKGTEPVTVKLTITGFQSKLFKPGH